MPHGVAPPKGRKRSIAQIQSMQKARFASTAPKDAASMTSGIDEKDVASQAGGYVHPDKGPTLAELVEKLPLTEEEVLEKNVEILEQGVALQTAKDLLDKSHDSVQAAKERGNMWHGKYHVDHKKLRQTEVMKEKLKEHLKMVQDLHLASQKDANITSCPGEKQ